VLVYLPPHRTHHTKTPDLQQRRPTNNQKPRVTICFEPNTISTHGQRKRRTVNNNPRSCTTQPSPNWTPDTTPLIIHHRPLLGFQSDTAPSTLHPHYAHVARTTSTHRKGRQRQPDSQVQPTHDLIPTDSNATQIFYKCHYRIQLRHFTTFI
jgi:hypothetical protein